MCMEDVRLGRKTLSRTNNTPVATTVGLFIPFNKDRVSLHISRPVTNNLWLSTSQDLGAGAGLRVGTVGDHLHIHIGGLEGWVRGPIYASITAVGENIGWTETMLEEQ